MRQLAIDLGTTNTRIYQPGKGIVVDEPSVVAIDASCQKIMAVGNEAKKMLGRTPESILAAYPLQNGVIASFRITESMLRYYINKIMGRFRLLRPYVMVSIPADITSTEKRAVIDVCLAAGAREAYVVKEPIAAALGAGVPIASAAGNLIIDIGGGTSEVAVIALGDVVAATSIRVGGNKINTSIANHLRKKKNLIIGEQTAEQVKIQIGSALPEKKEKTMEVSGSNVVTGLPESILLKSNDIVTAIRTELNEIIQTVKSVLQKTPPELASDVMDKGIILTGGGAQLRGIDQLMTKVTGVPCQVVENPEHCVVKGTGIAIENLKDFKKSILWAK
jgi:rod shape-determining protein MreB